MQQIRQRVLVVDVGGRDHRAVSKTRLAVHADVQLHTVEPLLAFAHLVHLGVTLPLGVLGRARRPDDRRVDDGSGTDLQAPALQHFAHLGEQCLAELVLFEQPAKLQQRGGIGYALSSKIDPDEAPQRGAVEQRVFAGRIRQIEPVLNEIHPQHPLEPDRRPSVARLRIERLDHAVELGPWHDLFHRR